MLTFALWYLAIGFAFLVVQHIIRLAIRVYVRDSGRGYLLEDYDWSLFAVVISYGASLAIWPIEAAVFVARLTHAARVSLSVRLTQRRLAKADSVESSRA